MVPPFTFEQIRERCYDRIAAKSAMAVGLNQTARLRDLGMDLVESPGRRAFSEDVNAIIRLANHLAWSIRDDIQHDITQLAFLIARDVIAPAAKESTEPVVFITGNSMMPPLREVDSIERLWDADDDVFSDFVEALEHALDENQIYMASPEDDNCLYVVDLKRWEHRDEGDMETWAEEQPEREFTFSDEWAPIGDPSGICVSCSMPYQHCTDENHGFDPERK